ncbi:MAG: alginate lyase family protein [PVC group bacterium]
MNRLKKIRLYWYSLRYSLPSQLAARFRLLLKRKLLSCSAVAAAAGAVAATCRRPVLSPGEPPPPLFPPRNHLAGKDKTLHFLNLSVPFTVPMNWHRPAWKKENQLELMNLHYMEYLEAFDDEMFVVAVRDWIRQNRLYGKGYWMDSWNSYSISIRCLVWMQQYALRWKRLDEETRKGLLSSLCRQIRFLRHNLEKDLKGNHLLKNCKTLIWAGRFFRGAESERWPAAGKKILYRELQEQILPDGMHYERSPAYHLQVFADLLECYRVIDGSPGEKRELAGVLRRMARVTGQLTHPDGLISLFNDGGLHMTYQPRECLDVYRELIGPPPVPEQRIELKAAGYYGFREGDEYLLVDCGDIGPDYLPAHGHGDLLAFEWDVGGRRIFVDAGVCEYRGGEMREYSRSTRSHNTVSVDDRDQCEFWKSFRAGRRARPRLHHCSQAGGRFVFEGSHNGFRHLAGRPVHRRRIESAGGRLKIEDRVEGGRGQIVKGRFLCHPDNDVFLRDNVCYIVAGAVKVKMETVAEIDIQDAWYMPDFGVRFSAKQIVVTYGRAPCGGSVSFEASERD